MRAMLAFILAVACSANAQTTRTLGVLSEVSKDDADNLACGVSQPEIEAIATLAMQKSGIASGEPANAFGPYLYLNPTTIFNPTYRVCVTSLHISVRAMVQNAQLGAPYLGTFKSRSGSADIFFCSTETLYTAGQDSSKGKLLFEVERNVKLCLDKMEF